MAEQPADGRQAIAKGRGAGGAGVPEDAPAAAPLAAGTLLSAARGAWRWTNVSNSGAMLAAAILDETRVQE